jgi:hypothetical protein
LKVYVRLLAHLPSDDVMPLSFINPLSEKMVFRSELLIPTKGVMRKIHRILSPQPSWATSPGQPAPQENGLKGANVSPDDGTHRGGGISAKGLGSEFCAKIGVQERRKQHNRKQLIPRNSPNSSLAIPAMLVNSPEDLIEQHQATLGKRGHMNPCGNDGGQAVRIEVLREASCERNAAELNHSLNLAAGSLFVTVEFATPNDMMLGVTNPFALMEHSPSGLMRGNSGIAKITAAGPEGIIRLGANPNLSNVVRVDPLPNITSRRWVAITHPTTLGQGAMVNKKPMVKSTSHLRRLLIAHSRGAKDRLQRRIATRDKILQHIDPIGRKAQQLRRPNLGTHGVLAVTNRRPQEHVKEVGYIIHVDK